MGGADSNDFMDGALAVGWVAKIPGLEGQAPDDHPTEAMGHDVCLGSCYRRVYRIVALFEVPYSTHDFLEHDGRIVFVPKGVLARRETECACGIERVRGKNVQPCI